MDFAPLPCTLSHFPHSEAVFERLANSKHPPPTMFSRSHATQHICFHRTEDLAQKSPFCVNRIQECSGRSQSYQKRIPEVHPAVVGLLQQV